MALLFSDFTVCFCAIKKKIHVRSCISEFVGLFLLCLFVQSVKFPSAHDGNFKKYLPLYIGY